MFAVYRTIDLHKNWNDVTDNTSILPCHSYGIEFFRFNFKFKLNDIIRCIFISAPIRCRSYLINYIHQIENQTIYRIHYYRFQKPKFNANFEKKKKIPQIQTWFYYYSLLQIIVQLLNIYSAHQCPSIIEPNCICKRAVTKKKWCKVNNNWLP